MFEIPPSYCWLIRWDEEDKTCFVHIYKTPWNAITNSWTESYKETNKILGNAITFALSYLNEAKNEPINNQHQKLKTKFLSTPSTSKTRRTKNDQT